MSEDIREQENMHFMRTGLPGVTIRNLRGERILPQSPRTLSEEEKELLTWGVAYTQRIAAENRKALQAEMWKREHSSELYLTAMRFVKEAAQKGWERTCVYLKFFSLYGNSKYEQEKVIRKEWERVAEALRHVGFDVSFSAEPDYHDGSVPLDLMLNISWKHAICVEPSEEVKP